AYSKIASAPTKLGEFLGCGVPCLGNTNIGDIADIIVGEKVGVVLSSFDADSIRVAVEELVCLTKQEGIQAHCRDVALRYFSLKEGVRSFDRIYRELVV
ncbi:MAG: glycosyltransferase, partial [Kordiimonadaceae bacterium]|nr:glycosyltransferase [Kordiimonadaceae bacterium]